MAVSRISNDTIQRIREKSVEKLPNVVKNISPEELKRRFTGLVVDSNESVVSEVNRIVNEINNDINEVIEMVDDLNIGVVESVIKAETLEEANASPKAQKAGSIAFIKM